MSRARILVVEDDEVIGRTLCQTLDGQGYAAEWAATGSAGLGAADREPIDLAVLDLGLPDMDGVEACRRLRAAHPGASILILTARHEEVEVVVGLDAGADDYVTKPFRLAELLARIRARLRQADVDGDDEIIVGDLRVDRAARKVWLRDQEVQLRPREFDLLTLLSREAGRALHRQRIVDEVWGRAWFGGTKSLDMQVAALRRKLGDPARWGGITTLRGIGYRLERPCDPAS